MVAAVAVVGIERIAEHLERLEPIVAVGVEDGGDQPSGQPLHEEAVKLRVVGIPIFLWSFLAGARQPDAASSPRR